MASSGNQLYLYDTTTGARLAGAVVSEGLDVYFPAGVRGWPDVLDCRIPPYNGRSLEENCDYAIHVRKFYILVTAAQVEASQPPTVTAED